MPKSIPPLKSFEKNNTSQYGEDGVIARALEIIGEHDRWCVEFGAGDGLYLSNTHTLINRSGYSAVLIEPADSFKELQRLYHDRPNIFTLNRYVNFEGPDALDSILASTPIPSDFDVLSIDIDGNDYHVWDALLNYRPKMVVIEFIPTIPIEVDFVQARNMSIMQGSSLTAMVRLALTKE